MLDLVDGSDPMDRAAEPWLHAALPAAAACDPSPSLGTTELCGRTVLRDARFAFADCDLGGGRVASGSLEILRALPDAPTCESRPSGIEETARIVLEREGPSGQHATLEGTAVSRFDRPTGEIGAPVRHVDLDMTRTISAHNDAHVRSAHLVASLDVRPSEDGVRTVDGSGSLALPRGGSVAIELASVVRAPAEVCAHPVGGTLTRTGPDGTSHELVFGPECGQATLDGSPLDLTTASLRRHGGRPGGI
ncbi:MAG: hypothetical protein U0353_13445 [Sandaracinus sp.]